MTTSEGLAQFIVGTRYQDLPPVVVAATKRYLLDTLGVAIGGVVTPHGKAMQAFLRGLGEQDEATPLGTHLRVSSLHAALANGTFIRALEMEDTSDAAVMHVAPGTIGAVLALAEQQRCTGLGMLTAIALGYEVSVRVGIAVSPSHAARGFHPSGTCGSFGATAAAARLLGLTESQTVAALGLAGLQAAGLFQPTEPIWRYLTSLNGGRAAHLGVTAALLARAGFPGSPTVFEAPYGFCAIHADSFDPSTIISGLGTRYLMPEVGLKLFPSSRFTQAPLATAILLKHRYKLDAEGIAEVVAKGIPLVIDAGNKPTPPSELDAQASIQYTVAVALSKGSYGLEDVSPESLRAPAIQRLMAKVKLEVDPGLEEGRRCHPDSWPTELTVRMKNGATYNHRMDYPPGSPKNPATPQQLAEKFRVLATRVLPLSQAEELSGAVERLEKMEDVRPFVRLWEAPL